jgi:pyrroline-5-carboxylate reductase
LAAATLAAGYEPGHILISEPVAARRAALAEELPGVFLSESNREVVRDAECIVLAVKPQILCEFCKPLAGTIQKSKPLIISIAAGVRSGDIEEWLGGDLPVVRVMPNQPALLRLGISGMYANEHTNKVQRRAASNIIGTTGPVIDVASEADIDAVTAVSGTGPAYFYLLVDMLVKVAVDMGLDYEDALTPARWRNNPAKPWIR